jgi:hypothetical protein
MTGRMPKQKFLSGLGGAAVEVRFGTWAVALAKERSTSCPATPRAFRNGCQYLQKEMVGLKPDVIVAAAVNAAVPGHAVTLLDFADELSSKGGGCPCWHQADSKPTNTKQYAEQIGRNFYDDKA